MCECVCVCVCMCVFVCVCVCMCVGGWGVRSCARMHTHVYMHLCELVDAADYECTGVRGALLNPPQFVNLIALGASIDP